MQTDSKIESRMTAVSGRTGVEKLWKKGKGLMDVENSVVIAGGGVVWGLNDNGKNTIV